MSIKKGVFKKTSTTKFNHSWSDNLLPYCQQPESHPDSIISFDTQTVIIKDQYPKAKYHYLVMPRISIQLTHLTKSHLDLLQHMYTVAMTFISQDTFKAINFQIGFHAVPSMKQLHMHVISTDFISPSLKNKKHYLSFTTTFFQPYQNVIDMIEKSNGVYVS
ncbi:HIT-like domain-containing protein [Globomyces pollinis-pini]|nr:HIT-like domain-containing protein [Globomyces pollinis-pini]